MYDTACARSHASVGYVSFAVVVFIYNASIVYIMDSLIFSTRSFFCLMICIDILPACRVFSNRQAL